MVKNYFEEEYNKKLEWMYQNGYKPIYNNEDNMICEYNGYMWRYKDILNTDLNIIQTITAFYDGKLSKEIYSKIMKNKKLPTFLTEREISNVFNNNSKIYKSVSGFNMNWHEFYVEEDNNDFKKMFNIEDYSFSEDRLPIYLFKYKIYEYLLTSNYPNFETYGGYCGDLLLFKYDNFDYNKETIEDLSSRLVEFEYRFKDNIFFQMDMSNNNCINFVNVYYLDFDKDKLNNLKMELTI